MNEPGNSRHAVHKFGLEKDVCVIEHAVLERDHYELAVSEVRAQHLTDVLCVGKVQRSVHFIENVDRRRFEEKQG